MITMAGFPLIAALGLVAFGAWPVRAPQTVPRIAVRARAVPAAELSPLSYGGGFQTKTALFETVVKRSPDGSIVPVRITMEGVARDPLR